MKSPRSLLLGRHHGAEAKLDLIRARSIASWQRESLPVNPAPIPAPMWRMLWIELVHKPRLAWAGIGACGLLALGLNGLALLISDTSSAVAASPLVAVREAVRERAQLLAELRGQETPGLSQPPPIATPDRNRRRSAIPTESGLWIA
jgi:hypothetical protein